MSDKPYAVCPLCKTGTLSVIEEMKAIKVVYADDTYELKMKPGPMGPQICSTSKHRINCSNCGDIDEKLYRIEATNHLGRGIIHWKLLSDEQKQDLDRMFKMDYNYMFKDAEHICEHLRSLKIRVSEVNNTVTIWAPSYFDDKIHVDIKKGDNGYPWGSILAAIAYIYTGFSVCPIVPEYKETMIDTIPALKNLEARHVGTNAEQVLKEYMKK
jgi:hypothetical protein